MHDRHDLPRSHEAVSEPEAWQHLGEHAAAVLRLLFAPLLWPFAKSATPYERSGGAVMLIAIITAPFLKTDMFFRADAAVTLVGWLSLIVAYCFISFYPSQRDR